MKKVICLIFAAIFYMMGLIGLVLPIVPQIPFLIIGTLFLCIASDSFKKKIIKSKFYNNKLKKYVENNKFLSSILAEEQ